MPIKNRIREQGSRSVKTITYTLAVLYILISVFPLVWMIGSSMKDNITIYRFPPKWIPDIPKSIHLTLDYGQTNLNTKSDYELDAMKTLWFTWKKMQNAPIGAMSVTGVRDGQVIYEASMPQYKFTLGRTEIVPTQLFSDRTMKPKLPIIREKRLSQFEWLGDNNEIAKKSNIPADLTILQRDVIGNLADSAFISGKVSGISETENWKRLFDNYIVLWRMASSNGGVGFPHFLWNSVLVTAASIAFQIVLGGLAGYALAHLLGKRAAALLTLFFVATIMIPEIAVLVPLYLTMEQLHLVNTLWGIILPHTAWGIVIFLYRGFFEQLPGELIQAARIDGATEFRIFWRLIVPLSIPIVTVISVMTFISVWNEFLWPLVVARSPSVWTFTVALNDFQNRQSMGANVIMSSLVLSTIPLMFIMISCQRLLVKGVSFTGLKG